MNVLEGQTLDKEPIAIIGIGCRLPGGIQGPSQFWEFLCEGKDGICEVPEERWSLEHLYDPNGLEPGKMCTRWGGFVDDIDHFDARFFGISRQEASRMDPQHRLSLEVTWEALEDAGIVPASLSGSDTGVFMGITSNDYGQIQFNSTNRDRVSAYTCIGSISSMVTNRIAYMFDLKGPSIPIDTACSASLVAIHLACQDLWRQECSLAIAGGVNAIFNPDLTIAISEASLLSPEGRCKTFDQQANGYVRSEGAGIVILKPLAQALADKDQIYAIIRASGMSQDGHKESITSPSGSGIESLLKKIYHKAGISPADIQYVEAQGTGTQAGDAIEANAVGQVLSVGRQEQEQCYIGSVKTNIGHLEAAAGVAGLIKVALMLHEGYIPPNLHFHEPNPEIPFEKLRLKVPEKLLPWPTSRNGEKKLASVNSFGIGGTNAHLVLENLPQSSEAAIADHDRISSHSVFLLPLSARSPEALYALAQSYLEFLKSSSPEFLHRICFSASLRRQHHQHRLAILGSDQDEIECKLQTLLNSSSPQDLVGKVDLPSSEQEAAEGLTVEPWLSELSHIYVEGKEIDWSKIYPTDERFIRLPSYPWQKQRYWHESEESWISRTGRLSQQVSAQPNLQDSIQAPTANPSSLEAGLSQIWKDVFELPSISTTDNFFELGGNSLLATSLIKQIERAYGKKLSLPDLALAPTIEQLARVLRGAESSQGLSPLLVSLKPTGSKIPLIAANPYTGLPYIYADLASQLDPDQPFYALQVKAYSTYSSLQEIAADYVDAIKTLQPEGPYRLFGWSGGAITVYEMAQQLTQRGEQVDLVIIGDIAPDSFDTFAKGYLLAKGNKFIAFFRQVWFLREIYAGSKFAESLRAKKSNPIAKGFFFLKFAQEFLAIRKKYQGARKAALTYQIAPYSGKLALVRTQSDERYSKHWQDPDLGWGKYVPEPVFVRYLPGNHFTAIDNRDNSRELARQIDESIKAVTISG